MCLVLIALDSHPDHPLIIAANRDEFYDRPTAPAAFWDDAPSVLAGRDLRAGGTWLGVDRRGRFAAVTNYRQGQQERPAPRSRGRLVSDFLTTDAGAHQYIEHVRSDAGLYNSFNLIAGDAGGLIYYSDRDGRIRTLARGVYGLSNHLLDTPWPKVTSTKTAFVAALTGGTSDPTVDLFALLADRHRADDHLLPATGIGRKWERLLSSAFIASDDYGTRSSTVVLAGRDAGIIFIERTFGRRGEPGPEARFQFRADVDARLPQR